MIVRIHREQRWAAGGRAQGAFRPLLMTKRVRNSGASFHGSQNDHVVFPLEETAAKWQISPVRCDPAGGIGGRVPRDGCCKRMEE